MMQTKIVTLISQSLMNKSSIDLEVIWWKVQLLKGGWLMKEKNSQVKCFQVYTKAVTKVKDH